jgi:hypothetical protein
LSGFGKRQNKVFSENQSIRGLFGFETGFQNCIWNLFSASGLSQICTIRHMSGNYQVRSQEVLKVPKTFLKMTLKTKETTYILVSENTFLSLFETTPLGHLQCFWKIH